MTPDDHRLIQDLFDRLAAAGPVAKDPQADRVINELFRANPNSGYLLVQTALVYEQQLAEQQARIEELEAQMAQSRQPSYSGGSFLGNRGSAGRGSVPSAGAPAPQQPWSQPQAAQRGPAYEPAPQGGGGPGFFRSALQTAAGVAGGMVFANAIGNMFGGGHAQASGYDQSGALRDADATQDQLQDDQLAQDAADDADTDAGYDDGGIDA